MKWAITISILATLFTPHIIRAENNDSIMVKILLLEHQVMTASNDTVKANALMSKAKLYKESDQHVEAIATLNRVNASVLSDAQVNNYHYQKAFSLFMTAAYSDGLLEILNIQQIEIFPEDHQILYLMLLLENERWSDFESEYLRLRRKELTDTLLIKKSFAKPKLLEADYYAKLSSQLPGLGMMKSGHVGKGVTSLGLQLLFVGFGVYNFSVTYYFTGLLSGIMPARKFYLGGKLLTHSLVEAGNQDAINDCKRRGYELIAALYKY